MEMGTMTVRIIHHHSLANSRCYKCLGRHTLRIISNASKHVKTLPLWIEVLALHFQNVVMRKEHHWHPWKLSWQTIAIVRDSELVISSNPPNFNQVENIGSTTKLFKLNVFEYNGVLTPNIACFRISQTYVAQIILTCSICCNI